MSSYTEDPSAPSMLRYQASLPKLPVPALESTCTKYLDTVKPLLTPDQFLQTKKAVSSFLTSPLATELQKRLIDRAGRSNTESWLIDWWNEAAYMGYRDPVVVNVSYFFVHKDDKRVRDPAKRAASLIKAMLPFRDLVEGGQLEPDRLRESPLCMATYKYLFHSSRYPVKSIDTATKFDPQSNNHIIVIRKNRFFLVPLAHPSTGKELTAPELEAQFNTIIELAGPGEASAPPVGVLTSDNRDTWADAREALVRASLDGKNEETLRKIEGAMIIVVLDDSKPITREEISWATWVGDGRNRWYDKHQLIVYDNGRSGFLGEHSCMDGTPTLRMNEFMLASLALNKIDLNGPSSSTPLPPPTEQTFILPPPLLAHIDSSSKAFDTLINSHSLHVLHYPGFGAKFLKKHGISPDAGVQLIKQLAFYKMEGRLPSVYESAQTRKFQRGRTEVIRSVSWESRMWVEGMLDDPEILNPTLLRNVFRTAASRHTQYASWAANGKGVDRHLFGLKRLLREGEPVPDIYKDPAYAKSSHWELSTSQLSSPFVDGWGYGEVVQDGFGLSYSIGNDFVRWTITSRNERRPEVLKYYLEEAAGEVRRMLEAAEKMDKESGQPEKGKDSDERRPGTL